LEYYLGEDEEPYFVAVDIFLSAAFQKFVFSIYDKMEIEDLEYEDILRVITEFNNDFYYNSYSNLYNYSYITSLFVETYNNYLAEDYINFQTTINHSLHSSFFHNNILLFPSEFSIFSSDETINNYIQEDLTKEKLEDNYLYYQFNQLELGDFDNFWGFMELEDIDDFMKSQGYELKF